MSIFVFGAAFSSIVAGAAESPLAKDVASKMLKANESANQSVNGSVNQSINSSANPSANGSVKQSPLRE